MFGAGQPTDEPERAPAPLLSIEGSSEGGAVPTESVWADPTRARRVRGAGIAFLAASLLVFGGAIALAVSASNWTAVCVASGLLLFAVWIFTSGYPRAARSSSQ